MKFNINRHIIPECHIDTNLVETLVPPQRINSNSGYTHIKGCNSVVKKMRSDFTDSFAVGIFDYDKRQLAYTTECSLIIEKNIAEKEFLKLYKHPQKAHYLILHPPIEQWILNEALRVNIILSDYDLPITLKGLIKERKDRVKSKNDPRFKKLFRDLKKENAVGINLLSLWVEYLKDHPYDADETYLKNIGNTP